jgi:hypothetical protein
MVQMLELLVLGSSTFCCYLFYFASEEDILFFQTLDAASQ